MSGNRGDGPQRIVCLTEETTETLYLLGEDRRIVGISGFTCRPKEARQKPKVSAFTTAKIDKILELRPDLVIGFSNLQAKIAHDLIEAGVNVLVFNQRSVEEILEMILTLARIVTAESGGAELVNRLRGDLLKIAESASRFPRRPRVYFEEWMDPLISGIRWVEELIEIAGGEPVFPQLRLKHSAKDRIVDPNAVVAANPEVIIASWCGRKVSKDRIRGREGWSGIDAVRYNRIYEVKSTYILQPGPASLKREYSSFTRFWLKLLGVSRRRKRNHRRRWTRILRLQVRDNLMRRLLRRRKPPSEKVESLAAGSATVRAYEQDAQGTLPNSST